jgi:hypothetical protein
MIFTPIFGVDKAVESGKHVGNEYVSMSPTICPLR